MSQVSLFFICSFCPGSCLPIYVYLSSCLPALPPSFLVYLPSCPFCYLSSGPFYLPLLPSFLRPLHFYLPYLTIYLFSRPPCLPLQPFSHLPLLLFFLFSPLSIPMFLLFFLLSSCLSFPPTFPPALLVYLSILDLSRLPFFLLYTSFLMFL